MLETFIALMVSIAAMQADPAVPDWVPAAIAEAADASHGYSYDNLHGDPDYICTSFAYHMLEAGGVALADDADDPSTSLSAQMRALEAAGFERLDGFGFEELPVGSVVYACTGSGSPKHVEVYIGTYDVDGNGNPVADADGTPLTCGARVTDRDPALGDQLQDAPWSWYGGEVGACAGDRRGEAYWAVAYVPPARTR